MRIFGIQGHLSVIVVRQTQLSEDLHLDEQSGVVKKLANCGDLLNRL